MTTRLHQLGLVLLLGTTALAAPARAQSESIVAVVNGDVISQNDVDNRGKLFALSTGIGAAPDILARLRPQVTRQLIDEKLRLQETQRRHIVVPDAEIAQAVKEIEGRNNLPPGALRARLGSQGVAFRTLIDQIRVQIGWNRVLRQEMGDKAKVSDAAVDEQMKQLAAQTGQPEYDLSQIFVPVDNPANAAEAQRFADTIIGQLRAGATFSVVAAQFSQDQNALKGGEEGWVQASEVDPQVAAVLAQMPVGAISNPISVPGGVAIVTLRAKREMGRDLATMMSVRQVFLPFSTPLNPQAPTDQQKHQLEVAHALQHSVHGCDAMEAANKANNSPRPANPGDVRLEGVNPPQFRAVLAALPIGQVSQPLVSGDGVSAIMVCARDTRNVAQESKEDVRNRLLSARIELESRQLQRDLQRRAVIDQRPAPANTASR